eukprot:355936-Chlamydomonas_euryale.AAC.3
MLGFGWGGPRSQRAGLGACVGNSWEVHGVRRGWAAASGEGNHWTYQGSTGAWADLSSRAQQVGVGDLGVGLSSGAQQVGVGASG